ncbi:MAG: biotin--[acetyl-CoA-carboxylase] ligase, partial [Pikeienuella sp.]
VLLESEGGGGALDWLAIGVGVNLVAAPPAEPDSIHPPTSLLAETGARLEPVEALGRIAARLAHWSASLSIHGFAPLREAWLARATRLGQRIEARMTRESVSGVFEDVDAEGALVLRTPNGIRRIHAADIYFR